jgi:hypothetical protein
MLLLLFLGMTALAGCGGALATDSVNGASTRIVECYACHEDAACIPQACDASSSVPDNSANDGGRVDRASPDADGGDASSPVEIL